MPGSIPTFVLASVLGVASLDSQETLGVPVLVELFTSEGCSSCPPADRQLARLVQEQPIPGARVIALGEHVDYWDDLGWKDSFSSPLFTQRQQEYVRRLGLAGPYTPQLVIGGQLQAVGGDASAARSAIAEVARAPAGSLTLRSVTDPTGKPALEIQSTWSGGEAKIVAAVVEDRAATRVSCGENAGRTLTHASVVRSMAVIGRGAKAFSGRVVLQRGGVTSAAHAVVFVQEPEGGRVYAANSIELPVPRQLPSGDAGGSGIPATPERRADPPTGS